MTRKLSSESPHVIWQEAGDGGIKVAEPALLVESYSDILSIQQGENRININYSSVDELCRIVKNIKKEKKGRL